MRIVVSQYVSVDGVIEDPVGMEGSGLGDWIGPYKRGPEGDRFKHEELFACDAVLLGRLTYDGFAAVWPTLNDPDGFAARMNSLPKFVVSTTLERAEWNNTTIIAQDVANEVAGLKAKPGRDIVVYGSGQLVQSLIQHDLVDEYRLMVYPVALGRGKRLFGEGSGVKLTLTDTRQFGDGIVLLCYEPARE
jgi:dihydrofolate reductase